jgi:parvulin-like peptidyl-prolyl isomerase
VVERVADGDAHIQAMLLSSEEEALAVSSRIKAGEDFATLAAELSQDKNSKESSGELGVISKGKMSSAFDAFAFNPSTEVGVLSPPVRDETVVTKGGYWLIQSSGKEDNRQIDAGDRDYLKSRAFDQWLAILDTSNTYSKLSDAQKTFAISEVLKG